MSAGEGPRRRRRGSRGWGPLIPDADGRAAGRPVSTGSMASHHGRNALNDLTRGEWRQFSQRTVFAGVDGAPWAHGMSGSDIRAWGQSDHPDRFPDGLAEGMVAFFTKRGGTVLDPFAGTGAALVACDRLGRRGMGIELHEKWAGIARKRTRQTVVCGDAINAARIAAKAGTMSGAADGERGVDLLLAGVPRPVWAAGRQWKYRKTIGYMDDDSDMSLVRTYTRYLDEVATRIEAALKAVRQGGHAVLVQPNEAADGTVGGRFIPAAFDVAARVGRMDGVEFVGEKVWAAQPRAAGARRRPDGGGPLLGYPHRYAAGLAGVEAALYCMVFVRHGMPDAGAELEAEPVCP